MGPRMIVPLLRRVYLPEGCVPMLGWRLASGLPLGWVYPFSGSPCGIMAMPVVQSFGTLFMNGDIYKRPAVPKF